MAVRKPKTRKTLRVARRAKPDDSSLLEHLGSPAGNSGPRYDKDGAVLEYSILGKYKHYEAQDKDEFANTTTVRLNTPDSGILTLSHSHKHNTKQHNKYISKWHVSVCILNTYLKFWDLFFFHLSLISICCVK